MRYILHQKDNYEYGDNIDEDKLMVLALNKYKNLCNRIIAYPSHRNRNMLWRYL